MLVTKSALSLTAGLILGTGAALGWQLHSHTQPAAATALDPKAADVRTLEDQVATQSRKLREADARLSQLLKDANTPRASAVTVQSPAAAVKRDALVDTNEIAKAAIEKGRALMKEGKSQEALDLYLATYREVQPLRPGSSACQSISSAMKYLGRTFAPAMSGLAQLRDDALRQLEAQPERRGELSFEIALLNERLAQGQRTIELYDTLPLSDMQRGSVAMVARDAFIQARRYQDALRGKAFGQMLVTVDASAQLLTNEPDPNRQATIRKSVIEQTATNIEVLAGAGKAVEAQQLTAKLLAFDNTLTTQQAIGRHLARAEGGSR